MIRDNIVFFWSGPFSNWDRSVFTYKGIKYKNSESAYMYEKALTFGDKDTAAKILDNQDDLPTVKSYGREVVGYDDQVWAGVRKQIMKDVCTAKFTQSLKHKKALLDTGDMLIVEASPYDAIWGIGLHETDPNIMDKSKWGQNLLGIVCMEIRDDMRT